MIKLTITVLLCLFSSSAVLYAQQAPEQTPIQTLTIQQVIQIALQQSRTVRIAASNLNSQRYGLQSAQSDFDVKLTPSLSSAFNGGTGTTGQGSYGAGLNVSKRLSSGANISMSPSISHAANSTNEVMKFSLAQPLLRGAGQEPTMNGVLGSQFAMRSQLRSFYRTRVNIVLQATSLFYDIATSSRILEFNQNIIDKLHRHALAAQAKEKIGFASQIDVLRAELELNNVQNASEQVREQQQNTLDQLKILLDLPVQTQLNLKTNVDIHSSPISEHDAIATALRERVDILQSDDELNESARSVRLAKDNMLPDLKLLVDYTLSRPGNGGKANQQWNMTLSSSTDFARTREKLGYQQSLLRAETVRINARQLKDRIIRETRMALRNLVKAKKHIQLRTLQIEQAKGKLKLANIKFDHNMADNFDIIAAERELTNARINLLQAKTTFLSGIYKLKATMGTLLPKPAGIQ